MKGQSKSIDATSTERHTPTVGKAAGWRAPHKIPDLPDGVEESRAARTSRATRTVGDITITRDWHRGLKHPKLAQKIGWLYRRPAPTDVDRHGDAWGTGVLRVPIRVVGEVQMGLGKYVVAVAEGSTWVLLAKDARIWRYSKVHLDEPCPYLTDMQLHQRIAFAEKVCALFEHETIPLPERELMGEAVSRYRALVAAFVNERIVDAGTRGVVKDANSWAAGISANWSSVDLLRPRCPSMLHALLVSLVLSLDARKAGALVSYGAFIEYRIPLVSETVAEALYQQACHLLAGIAPEWWAASYLTDWATIGSIESKFAGQFARLLAEAWKTGAPVGPTVDKAAVTGRADGLEPGPEREVDEEAEADPLEEDEPAPAPAPRPEARTVAVAFTKPIARHEAWLEEKQRPKAEPGAKPRAGPKVKPPLNLDNTVILYWADGGP